MVRVLRLLDYVTKKEFDTAVAKLMVQLDELRDRQRNVGDWHSLDSNGKEEFVFEMAKIAEISRLLYNIQIDGQETFDSEEMATFILWALDADKGAGLRWNNICKLIWEGGVI